MERATARSKPRSAASLVPKDGVPARSIEEIGKRQEIAHRERDQNMREDYARSWGRWAKAQLLLMYALMIGIGVEKCPVKIDAGLMKVFIGATLVQTFGVVLAITHGLFGQKR